MRAETQQRTAENPSGGEGEPAASTHLDARAFPAAGSGLVPRLERQARHPGARKDRQVLSWCRSEAERPLRCGCPVLVVQTVEGPAIPGGPPVSPGLPRSAPGRQRSSRLRYPHPCPRKFLHVMSAHFSIWYDAAKYTACILGLALSARICCLAWIQTWPLPGGAVLPV